MEALMHCLSIQISYQFIQDSITDKNVPVCASMTSEPKEVKSILAMKSTLWRMFYKTVMIYVL